MAEVSRAPDGFEAWQQVIERGYEGYVAKDEASADEGGRTKRWLKVSSGAGPWRRTMAADDQRGAAGSLIFSLASMTP